MRSREQLGNTTVIDNGQLKHLAWCWVNVAMAPGLIIVTRVSHVRAVTEQALGVPEQALGGILLGFGIDKPSKLTCMV